MVNVACGQFYGKRVPVWMTSKGLELVLVTVVMVMRAEVESRRLGKLRNSPPSLGPRFLNYKTSLRRGYYCCDEIP